jgi:hypothetical protein
LGALEDEFVTGLSGLSSLHGSFCFSGEFCNSLVDWVFDHRKLAKSVLGPFTVRFKEKLDNVVLISFKVNLPAAGKHFSDDTGIRLISLIDAFFSILRLWSIDNFHYEKTKIVFLLTDLSQNPIYNDFIKR